MTGAEFAAIRWRLQLHQNQLAEVLSVHPVTVNKWERGNRTITRVVELAMKGLLCEQECRHPTQGEG